MRTTLLNSRRPQGAVFSDDANDGLIVVDFLFFRPQGAVLAAESVVAVNRSFVHCLQVLGVCWAALAALAAPATPAARVNLKYVAASFSPFLPVHPAARRLYCSSPTWTKGNKVLSQHGE